MLFMTGCSHINMGTLWALRGTTYESLDPEVTHLAIALSEAIHLQSVHIEIAFKLGELQMIDETIELDIITSGPEMDKVGFPDGLYNRFILRVPREKIEIMKNFQHQISLTKNSKEKTQMSFGIGTIIDPQSIKDFCKGKVRRVNISAWILTDPKKGYLPLIKDSDLSKLLGSQTQGFCHSSLKQEEGLL